MNNPYRNLEDYCYWPRAMSSLWPGHLDPVTNSLPIEPNHKVATMGSCFAQHLGYYISQSGPNFFVAEEPPTGMSADLAQRKNYGVFSARYGNIYTVKQALQLFDRAFGHFQPRIRAWARGNVFVDPFRPLVEPDGYQTIAEVVAEAEKHLCFVRDVFLASDWIIFTLGLTEAWRSLEDDAIYPVAPGVAGGEFDSSKYEFVNFSYLQVRDDLFELIGKIREVNSKVKVLLTVSPVSLMATYEHRHVLVSTTLSKSVLRAVADEAERSIKKVIYFPSYEIITSPTNEGRYYQDDFRQVSDVGIKHVMRIFGKHFFQNGGHSSGEHGAKLSEIAIRNNSKIVCDEEAMKQAFETNAALKHSLSKHTDASAV
ncbi:MAG: GSCFA domain-containing protein [Betaproteobacteria bacterium]|nr:GSCFA domain-containing protein [Betaproteobacteria bacterium]